MHLFLFSRQMQSFFFVTLRHGWRIPFHFAFASSYLSFIHKKKYKNELFF